uniref:Uncharacterized protein n=1 Tax=Knipowitschia caucasica TaxID=637954 RepID=A0AAV2JIW5_KNICA
MPRLFYPQVVVVGAQRRPCAVDVLGATGKLKAERIRKGQEQGSKLQEDRRGERARREGGVVGPSGSQTGWCW